MPLQNKYKLSNNDLDSLWRRGCQFLGTKYAILGGAMSWLSEKNLVSAISEAGGFGVIACGSMSPDQLALEIRGTSRKTKNPFGVNLILLHPELDALVDTCIKEEVKFVVLAGGMASRQVIDKLNESQVKVIAFAPTLAVAKKMHRHGVGALIIEGMEAGGHIGPVSTNVLAQEILPYIRDIPVFVGGGIGRGEMIASFLAMGASGCQLGTRFVCAKESIAHKNFKTAFIKASARDAQVTTQIDPNFPVIPVRAISNEGTNNFIEAQRAAITRFRDGKIDQKTAQLEIEHFWAGALKRAVIDGDVVNGSLMAGQSVGMVKAEQSVEEIVQELVEQANMALK
ncbi:MAG: 2-nitropropane dioxygenase [Rhodospirillaceae bacterium]|nr:2-nitropropane dioxygenase [Rhodospirillaceae bacterium]|tara:strand:- start:906 stop:1928 length:1023 start_codon:yes stop_codon:yes gene_type:complete